MAQHNELGKWGEDIAARFLEEKGWYIRHRNWRHKHAELDIVCIDENDTTILFVEVKTRSTLTYTPPAQAVDAEKRQNILEAAEAYIHSFRKENRRLRFDIISVIGTPDTTPIIQHDEGAFTMIDIFEDDYAAQRRKLNSIFFRH